jgi:exosortase/archaeosortase family protein
MALAAQETHVRAFRPSPAIRAVVVILAIAAAYNFSLLTLVRGLTLDTPLAYLGLVPFLSLLLAGARTVVHPPEPEIHDRHVDYIVGVPILIAALAVIVILPVPLSTFFWLWRLDLLSLPLFVFGVTSIVFGLRAVWRLKAAIAFLLLAWPIPYLFGISNWLDRFSAVTIGAVKGVVAVVPIAQPGDLDASYFTIHHGAQAFVVGVSSACTGANGLVGFILIGAAFIAVVSGRLLPKLLWLACGLTMIWLSNVVRILLIFAAGSVWGESFAIHGLHPFIGLVALNLGLLAMLLAMPLFGLRIRTPAASPNRRASEIYSAAIRSGRARPAVQRAGLALSLVVIAAALAAPANAWMQRFELLAHDLGPPRLSQIDDSNAKIDGWSITRAAQYDWVSAYFGQGASWDRYVYSWDPVAGKTADYRSDLPVTMDVIRTSDLHTFSEFGLQACYLFHQYRILDNRRVDLGGGVTAHAVTYVVPDYRERWSAVYWEWPVDHGGSQEYERVVLNRVDISDESALAPPAQPDLVRSIGMSISNAVSIPPGIVQESSASRPVGFLTSFGRRIVATAAAHSAAASQASR